MSTAIAPPGWYPDPAGSVKRRWWDGQHWTDRLEYPSPELQPSFEYRSDGTVTRRHEYI